MPCIPCIPCFLQLLLPCLSHFLFVYLCYIGCLINLINNVTICGSLLLPLLCLSHKSEINCHNHTDTITPVRSHSLITFKTNKWNRMIISRLCFLGCCSCFSSDLCNEWSNFEGSLEVLENFSRICTGGTFVLNQWEFLHLVAATNFQIKVKSMIFYSFLVLCNFPLIPTFPEEFVSGTASIFPPGQQRKVLVRSPHICWCVAPTFGPLRARLAPHPPFSISALPPSYTASSPISENTLLVFSSFSKVSSLYQLAEVGELIHSLHLFANMRKPPAPITIYRCLINWNVTFSLLRNWFTTIASPLPLSSIDNFDGRERGNVITGHA